VYSCGRAHVCQAIEMIAYCRIVFTDTPLAARCPIRGDLRSLSSFAVVLRAAPNLQHINLSRFAGMSATERPFASIERELVADCPQFTTHQPLKLRAGSATECPLYIEFWCRVAGCPNLQHIDLQSFGQVSDKSLRALCASCQHLRARQPWRSPAGPSEKPWRRRPRPGPGGRGQRALRTPSP
jgi:hypothetical protein